MAGVPEMEFIGVSKLHYGSVGVCCAIVYIKLGCVCSCVGVVKLFYAHVFMLVAH